MRRPLSFLFVIICAPTARAGVSEEATGFFDTWPALILLFAVGLILLLALLAFVARFEKRMVWPYGPPQKQRPAINPIGYGMRRTAEAVQAGFTLFGWSPDMKGAKYQITYALLASPARDSFAIIAEGTIFNIPLQGTWIHTPAAEGRSYYSTDHQSCIEIDISRLWRSRLVSAGTFEEHWNKHQQWIQRLGVTPRGLEPGRELEDFRTLLEGRARAMAQRGLIAYIDSSSSRWRYTWYGAFKLALLNYSIGMLRTLTFKRFPKSA
jgi:hypothetical protein